MKKNKSSCMTSADLTKTGTMRIKTPYSSASFSSNRAGRRRSPKSTRRRGRPVCFTLASLVLLCLVLLAILRPDRSEAQTCTNSPTQCATPGKDGAGGTLSGVVNTYYQGNTATAGSTTINVSKNSARGSASRIASGDLLLIIQMQAAAINSTDTNSYGDGVAGTPASGYSAVNSTGLYEYVKATGAVANNGNLNITGGTGGGLINTYTSAAATATQGQETFQVIRVPQYSSCTLGSTLTVSGWNGSTGGILAIDVSTTVDLGSATVDVSGMGFRGGGGVQLGGTGTNTEPVYRSPSTTACHAAKGEGIAGTPEEVYDPSSNSVLNTAQANDGYPNGSNARGAPGNAGGGGSDDDPSANDDNSGGGGGGNGGAGGKGGLTWFKEQDLGGFGGAAFADASACRIILGGGGGAGTRNNDDTVALASCGAAGGGMVFIRCRYVTGTGTIKANGSNAFNDTLNDGGGGGGAGGTIVFSALKSLTVSTTLSNLTVSAHGGLGGDAWRTQPVGDTNADTSDNRHGPGGGGGGGAVYLSSAAASIDVTGGAHGITTTSNDTYGSVSGSAGTSTTSLTPDQITGVFSGAQCSSTAVEMVSFDAINRGDKVHLKWRTGYEVDNVGFNVYREQDNVRTRLTRTPAAGSALVAGPGSAFLAGRSYNWWDKPPGGSSAQYWLEEIDLSGKRTWHGPVVPAYSGEVERLDGPENQEAALLSSIGYRGRRAGPDGRGGDSGRVDLGLTRPLEERAVPVTQIGSNALSVVAQDAGGGVAAKLSVRHEGWYRVAKADLVAAGFSPAADTKSLQLFAEGAEQAILVTTDKSGYAVEFYGTGLASPYTDARVYWLSFGNQFGQRIQPATGQGGMLSPTSFPYTVQRQDRSLYWVSLLNGDKENFFGDVVTSDSADEVMQLTHVDKGFGGQATLQLAVQGFTTVAHRVSVTLNGAAVGELDFNNQDEGFSTISVPQALLMEGANDVVLTALGGDDDLSLVDYVRITYNHLYAADSDALKFTAFGGQGVNLGGFTRSDVRVMDITKPSAPQSVPGTVTLRSGGYTLSFTPPGSGPRTLLAFAGDQVNAPDAITFNSPSSWRQPGNRADLVIITNRGFLDNIKPLQALRQSQGLAVALVDVVDLYNEFSYGEKTPQAIKNFLSFANTNWQKAPRFVLLAGHASYDPNNYLGEGYWDMVPTRLIDTQTMETGSDDWFVDFSGTGYPGMAIGRLPFRTTQEADLMVGKILNYERTFQGGGAVLVADATDSFNFVNATHQVRALLPPGMPVQEIDEDTTVSPKSVLLNSLNQGPKLVNYAGHGSVDLWRGDLLTNDDALQLANGQSLPTFVLMTCLNGYDIDPALDSLGESLLKAPAGGAVAVWASSSFTEPPPQAQLNQQLYRLLFGTAGITLGEATARAKTGVQDSDVRKTWILFGDPTMRLK